MKKAFKKILVTIAILFSITAAISFTSPKLAHAESAFGSCRDFLGMTSWDCGVVISDGKNLGSGIWTIAANIFVDLGVIATYLTLGYIIYGGYLYMFSSGDPAKAMAGRKTLARAFIGLGIVMLANIILNTIRIALLGSNGSFDNCASGNCIDASTMVKTVIDWFIGVSGLVAAIFVVVGGVGYMTSRGDPGKLQKAKSTILYALIGLAIVALSRIIVTFVYDNLKDNSDFETYGSSLIQDSTIM